MFVDAGRSPVRRYSPLNLPENLSGGEFRPPSRGAPATRLTGGSRGSGDATITLDVLAPDETGLTTQEQPSLFW